MSWPRTSSSSAPRTWLGDYGVFVVSVMLPPPLWGPPPPLCGTADVGAIVMPGPPGAGWVGDGGGSNGTALTGPTPNISVDMPTPAAIVAALATRLRSIVFHSHPRLLRSTCWLAATQGTPKLTPQRCAATPSSQLPTVKMRPNCRAGRESSDRSARRRSGWGALLRVHRLPTAASGASRPDAPVPPAFFGWNARPRRTRIRLAGWGWRGRVQRGGVDQPYPARQC